MMDEFRTLTAEDAADFIEDTKSALIVCHSNPDGDAIGSAIALKRIIVSLGGRAAVASPTPLPEYASFLAQGEEILYKESSAEDFERVIAVDTASAGQLGALSPLAQKVSLTIDHHANAEPFSPNITVPTASAAGEVIFDIYGELRMRGDVAKYDPDVCRCLFAAISSDTGSFKYSNTTPKTFMAASELSQIINGAGDGGYMTWDISRLIHDTVTEKDLKISAAIPGKIKLYEDGALAVCLITADDMKRLGAEERDMGGAIDIVRSLKGVLVAVTVRQRKDGSDSYKISARANEDIDVSAVCGTFGGGGHIRAAGATLPAPSPAKALKLTVDAFRPSVAEYVARGGKKS